MSFPARAAHEPRSPRESKPPIHPGALLSLLSSGSEYDVSVATKAIASAVQLELAASGPEPSIETMTVEEMDRILDAHLVNGLLVVSPTDASAVLHLDPRRAARAKVLADMRNSAWAVGTRRNYGSGLMAYRAWCKQEGVLPLPLSPANVAHHLIDYALEWSEATKDVVRDEDGNLIAAVVVGTVDLRLAALNKCAEVLGLPKPGDNQGVRELMRGLRRTFLTAPRGQKLPLTHDLLESCLVAADGLSRQVLRDRCALLIRAASKASAGQLASLCWVDVAIDDTGAHLDFVPTHRNGAGRRVHIPRNRTNSSLCAVRSLELLRASAPHGREVFTETSDVGKGKPLTRQALHLAVSKAAESFGGWAAIPTATARAMATAFGSDELRSLQTTRDRALLLTGFWGALRRSNLSILRWDDLDDRGADGIMVTLRWSKTDQTGEGAVIVVPASSDGSDIPNPAEALREWRDALTRSLGRPPAGSEPVFVRLAGTNALRPDTRGRLQRLSGDAINDIVQRLVVAAGIAAAPAKGRACRYGAHSLRAGFITEAALAGLSIKEIMEVTQHRSPAMVLVYVRLAEQRKNGTSRRLLGHLDAAKRS